MQLLWFLRNRVMHVPDVLIGHSKAMYSSWMLYHPDNILFDCGEGCALALNQRVCGVDTVVLSHGHLDHIMGLSVFFFARTATRGDKLRPLQIVHPAGDPDIQRLREFIERSFDSNHHPLTFPVTWTGTKPGDTVKINDN